MQGEGVRGGRREMTKCFQCIKDEYHHKIKWSHVGEAIVILNGTGYCYEHLRKELNWKEGKKNDETIL